MIDITTYLGSGILERFVLGDCDATERAEVEHLAQTYPEIAQEIQALQLSIERYAQSHAVSPPSDLRKRFKEIGKSSRKKKAPDSGVEENKILPELAETSSLLFWRTQVKDIPPPAQYDNHYTHALAKEPNKRTYLAWLKHNIPEEVHDRVLESFFILEGTCNCFIDGEITEMKEGDFMAIPLHKAHHIEVTSSTSLKVIVQRKYAA